jgi:VanZ family protein
MQFFRKTPFLPAVLFFVLTAVLLTLPGNRFPKSHWFDIPYFDKWIHIGLFGLLCFLFTFPIQDFSITHSQKRNRFFLITLLGIGYGTMMEFVQKYWIPNRSFEGMDILADCTGCLLALFLSLQILRKSI